MLSQEYFKQILCGFSHADHCYKLLLDLAVQGLTATVKASAPGGRKDAKLTV
jgi:hypothetical protein